MKLLFLVRDQALIRLDNHIVVSDTKDYVRVQFVFNDNEWYPNEISKIQAVFWIGDNHQNESYKYANVDPDTGFCDLPEECLKYGHFLVSLYGSSDTTNITTNRISIPVQNSGFDGDGSEMPPPPPNLYEEMLKRSEMLDSANGVVTQLVNDVDYLKNQYDKIDTALAGHERDIFANETNIAENTSEISKLKALVNDINARVTALEIGGG